MVYPLMRGLSAALLLALLAIGHAQAQVGPLQAQRNLGDLSNIPAAQTNMGMGGLGTKSTAAVAIQWTGGSNNVVVADTYYPFPLSAPWSGTITSIDYLTGGSSSPSFTASLQINGVNVTGCSGIVVSSSSKTTATCTGSAAFSSGQTVTLIVTGVTGNPFDAVVSVNYVVNR